MPMKHLLFERLQELLIDLSSSQSWFAFAEQAINAIYILAEHPDLICGQVIKKLTGKVFGISNPGEGDISALMADMNAVNINSSSEHLGVDESSVMKHATCSSIELAKLCFVVGHVSIKQIVHLELVESDWKRRKQEGISMCAFFVIYQVY